MINFLVTFSNHKFIITLVKTQVNNKFEIFTSFLKISCVFFKKMLLLY
nr:MAG TPA: hypothetical protein [Caudoviricetes sp.]